MRTVTAWHDLDATERTARLRSLAMAARLLAGPKASRLCALLRQAERDPGKLADCDAAMGELPTVPMRKILATFAATLP